MPTLPSHVTVMAAVGIVVIAMSKIAKPKPFQHPMGVGFLEIEDRRGWVEAVIAER